MVTFILVKKNGAHLIYWYYPEGNEALKPGIIEVDLDRTEIKVTELAEEDWERNISPEELNEVVEAINRMKRERGDTDFVKLATEAERSIFYGDHAVGEICKHLKKGEIPERAFRLGIKEKMHENEGRCACLDRSCTTERRTFCPAICVFVQNNV